MPFNRVYAAVPNIANQSKGDKNEDEKAFGKCSAVIESVDLSW